MRTSVAEPAPRRSSTLRGLTESLICLVLAVVLFRTFEVEGYMISTGSMAPSLFGYHKRVTCPTCGYRFACGVAVARREAGSPMTTTRQTTNGPCATVPTAARPTSISRPFRGIRAINCWCIATPISFTRRDDGRWSSSAIRRMRRRPTSSGWSVCRGNRSGSSTATCSSMARFAARTSPRSWPCESRCTTTTSNRDPDPERPPRAGSPMRVPPDRPSGKLRMRPSRSTPRETAADRPPRNRQGGDWAWVTYRHVHREGGRHVTAVPLEIWPSATTLPESVFAQPVWFDSDRRELCCTGVLSVEWQERLLRSSGNGAFRSAVQRLAAESRVSPVMDDYAYNLIRSATPTAVRDLMVSARVKLSGSDGEFVVRMTDGTATFDALFDVARRELRLYVDGAGQPDRTAKTVRPICSRNRSWSRCRRSIGR